MPSLKKLIRTVSFGVRGVVTELALPGGSELSGRALWTIGVTGITITLTITNAIGIFGALAATLFVIPLPSLPASATSHAELAGVISGLAYAAAALPLGAVLGVRRLLGIRGLLLEEREATETEQQLIVSAPLRLALMQSVLWGVAAIGAVILLLPWSTELGVRVAFITAFAGITTGALAYLLSERLMRPVAARALASADPGRFRGRGVATRSLLAWAAGTGVPVLGMMTIGIFVLAGQHSTTRQLAIAMVSLSGVVLTVGFLAVGLAARATADPIDSVRRALARVQQGDFDVRVPVYDGTQVGLLQRGFNEMVAGLAERERLREAFGAYVDPEVAEHILREGISLEGEDVEVTVMFVDVRDFTGFAEERGAREVVAALNRLFAVIVPIIHRHGGWVDKFIGDGLLAVFGAPRRQADHADRALAAAVEIARAVQAAGELQIGIGLNSGRVVAGNVGAPERVEFSVIGDPVNVAARVEAATRETGDRILIAERTRQLLSRPPDELVPRRGVELKGKSEPVSLYAVELQEAGDRTEA